MTHLLTDVHLDEVSLVEQGADQDAHVVLFKSATPREDRNMTSEMNTDLAKALEGVEGVEALSPEIVIALNALVEARAPQADPVAAPVADEVAKTEDVAAVEPEATEAEDLTKSAAFVDMQKRLEATEAELAKARETAAVGELVTRVKAEASALSLDAEGVAKTLYRVGKGTSNEADRDAILKLFGAASAAVAESGAFVEAGKTTTAGDADENEFGKYVAKLMSETPGLTKPAAVAKAIETPEGKRLYAASR